MPRKLSFHDQLLTDTLLTRRVTAWKTLESINHFISIHGRRAYRVIGQTKWRVGCIRPRLATVDQIRSGSTRGYFDGNRQHAAQTEPQTETW